MRTFFQLLLAVAVATSISCKKGNSINITNDDITATGTLQKIQASFIMYGTHTLNDHLLESKTIDLDKFAGSRVIITAKNTHYRLSESDPELYNVTSIVRVP
jgi:hypothetical protein